MTSTPPSGAGRPPRRPIREGDTFHPGRPAHHATGAAGQRGCPFRAALPARLGGPAGGPLHRRAPAPGRGRGRGGALGGRLPAVHGAGAGRRRAASRAPRREPARARRPRPRLRHRVRPDVHPARVRTSGHFASGRRVRPDVRHRVSVRAERPDVRPASGYTVRGGVRADVRHRVRTSGSVRRPDGRGVRVRPDVRHHDRRPDGLGASGRDVRLYFPAERCSEHRVDVERVTGFPQPRQQQAFTSGASGRGQSVRPRQR